MTLRARVLRLERFALPRSSVPDLWVEVMSYDPVQAGRGITTVKSRDRVWARPGGETEDDFRARVAAEASGRPPRLFVCAHGDRAPWTTGCSPRA